MPSISPAYTAGFCRMSEGWRAGQVNCLPVCIKNNMLSFKGMRFPIHVILVCIRQYFLPFIEKVACKHKHSVGGSWRMGETSIKVKGVWKYLYRAVDKPGKTVHFLLIAKRDMAAATRFFDKAIGANGVPDKVAMDKSGAHKAAIDAINASGDVPIVVRQVKYLNNIVEQYHCAINGLSGAMLNIKSFRSAACVLAAIELMHKRIDRRGGQ